MKQVRLYKNKTGTAPTLIIILLLLISCFIPRQVYMYLSCTINGSDPKHAMIAVFFTRWRNYVYLGLHETYKFIFW